MKYLICNGKDYGSLEDYRKLKNTLLKENEIYENLILCTSTPFLGYMYAKNWKVASSDISPYPQGAYTSFVSGSTLKSIGVKYVLIGHNEVRKLRNETLEERVKKIEQALLNHLTVIYCMNPEEENAYQEYFFIYSLLKNTNFFLALEPSSYIGKEEILNLEEIKKQIYEIKKSSKNSPKILYGGGISEKNVDNLLKIKELDGLLLGKTSLDADFIRNTLRKIKSFDTE